VNQQVKLVPEAGLGQIGALSANSNSHPQRLRHQRQAASCESNTPIIKHFHRFVKSGYYAPINHPVLSNYSLTTRSLALSLELLSSFLVVRDSKQQRFINSF
jgi:hypothetical protein